MSFGAPGALWWLSLIPLVILLYMLRARREAVEMLARLSAPMMPHLAESCWQALGHTKLVAETPWPKHDPALTASNSVTLPIQVNGKRRGEFRRDHRSGRTVPRGQRACPNKPSETIE